MCTATHTTAAGVAIDPADPVLSELLAALVDAEDALNCKLKSTLRPGSGAATVAGKATGGCGPTCAVTPAGGGGGSGVGISLPSVRRVLALWGIGGGAVGSAGAGGEDADSGTAPTGGP